MADRRRRWVIAIGLVAVLVGVVAIGVAVAVLYTHHPEAAHQPPHIKVRIGNWYTRHIGRWT